MATTSTLAIKIIGDSKSAEKAFDTTNKKVSDTENRVNKFSDTMSKAAVPAAIAGTALAAMGKQALDAASSLQQTTGAVEAVFKESAAGVEKLAATSADRLGLAASKYKEFASLIGSQLKGSGVATKDLAGETDKLISMGADLAAQFGGSTADAVSALSGVLKGETDPIERYGISIKAADIEAKKAELGLKGLTGQADKAATRQAALALLTAQSADATGAFAREADTAAGAQERANAKFEDTKAKLGTALLPVAQKVSAALGNLADWISKNSGVAQTLAITIGGLVAAVLIYNGATAAVSAVVGIATAVQWAFNAAMAAGPWLLIVAGIALVIGAIYLIVTNFEKVKEIAGIVWDGIVTGAIWLKDQTVGVFNTVWGSITSGFDGFKNYIKSGIDGIVEFFLSIPSRIAGWFNGISLPQWVNDVRAWLGFSIPQAGFQNADIGLFTASTAIPYKSGYGKQSTTPGNNGFTINISGALDPQSVARQIRDILNSDARLRGVRDATGLVIA